MKCSVASCFGGGYELHKGVFNLRYSIISKYDDLTIREYL